MEAFNAVAIARGFGVGAIVGMTGVVVGSLTTTLLKGLLRLHRAVAIGTGPWSVVLVVASLPGSVARTLASLSRVGAGREAID